MLYSGAIFQVEQRRAATAHDGADQAEGVRIRHAADRAPEVAHGLPTPISPQAALAIPFRVPRLAVDVAAKGFLPDNSRSAPATLRDVWGMGWKPLMTGDAAPASSSNP